MNALSERAEQIAGVLVGGATGATATPLGSSSAIDYRLDCDDGRVGALEVTLVVDQESADWQGMAIVDAWRWPAARSWEFRLATNRFRYRTTKAAAMEVAVLCDEHGVDSPAQLPSGLARRAASLLPPEVGALRRVSLASGIQLFADVRAGFVEAEPLDFANVVESWLALPHVPRHVEKTLGAKGVDQRHLFVAVTDDALPVRFFTNDFDPPVRTPHGFEGLDGLWVWSNFWHQFLAWCRGSWAWHDFPPK